MKPLAVMGYTGEKIQEGDVKSEKDQPVFRV